MCVTWLIAASSCSTVSIQGLDYDAGVHISDETM
jgi:hypothetical protein